MARRITEAVNRRLRQIAIEKREDLGSSRYPTAREVRQALIATGEVPYENLPGERHIRKVLKALAPPMVSDIDGPWSLGMSRDHKIPDEATGAIMEVWQFSIRHPSADTLSIRTARWVSQLRWVVNAGGSHQGVAVDSERLYHIASLYSGRERQVELIKNKPEKATGMRSGVLDAHIMLGSKLAQFAQRLGVLEDDAGIDIGDALSTVAPSYKRKGDDMKSEVEVMPMS